MGRGPALKLTRTSRARELLTWAPLAHLGTVSYGAYLLHGFWLIVFAGLPWQVMAPLVVVATWASSALVWRTLERPILAWRDAPLEAARTNGRVAIP